MTNCEMRQRKTRLDKICFMIFSKLPVKQFLQRFACLLYLSGWNEKGRQQNNESEKAFVKTKEYVWHQNKDYVGGATC